MHGAVILQPARHLGHMNLKTLDIPSGLDFGGAAASDLGV